MIALEVLKKKKERNEKEQRLTRSFDRYPQNVTPDFRQLDTESLKRYIEVYKLDCHMNAPRVQLAGVVARHFRGELDASEEEILPNFVEYILNYNGGNSVKRIKQENKRQTRQRKRTENDDVRVKKKTVRKERSGGPSRAESKRSIVQDSSSQASQDVGEALGVEEDSSVRKATSSTTERRGRKPGSTAKATKDSSSKKGKGTPRGRDGKGTSGRGAKRKNSSNSSLTAAAKAKKRRGSTASSNSRNKSSKAEKAKAKKNEDAIDSQDEEISSQLEAGEQSQDTTLDDDDADSRSSGTRRYCVCKGLSYGEMIACDNDKCSIEWFHVGCVDVSPEKVGGLWFCPDCKLKQGKSSEAAAEKVLESTEQESQDVNASNFMAEHDGAGSWGKKADAPPYVEMIREAIAKLPQQRGTHAMICKQIESKFGHHLNWKPEPKTPVWKSSVRKILCQTDRFYKVDEERQMYAVVQKDAK